ncbi:alpha-amylase [Seonamhaeicola sp. S2-3]|uniref:alpha-amylase family glycosyl hydrolase n=1 Tax=Seonamhaeicola sp. S2-3 TaxID=1936081 RepID=UPI0009726734|nr:alpha-amylase family glycosyl hydrolase [Seonamhaeicola sp. S2-3]APY11414.1 alpha-amylase [Seonamhaeicola sp. S2-3]
MKNIFTLLCFFISSTIFGQVTITPYPFNVNESITITVDVNSTASNCNGFSNPTKVYMHSGIGDDSDAWGYNVVGNWGEDDGAGEMTDNGNGTWSITLVPETYYSLTSTQAENAIKMGMVFRNEDGSQELKANDCSDFYFDVGTFQVSLSSPAQNSTTILSSGESLSITASNIGGNAEYVLKANDVVINTQSDISSYSYTHTNITSNQIYSLEVTLNGTTIIKNFTALVDPGQNISVMPTDYQNGITYLSDTEAVLVLYASGKDFIYVAGSFNNWQPDANYAMNWDVTRNKFWITLTGLTPGQIETYQYWVVDKNPPANSPELVKTADPYSTLVLFPFDDPYISATTYPNLPEYPEGQEREVTVLQTGQTEYNWQVTNFSKPKKEDLVIYEVLIRDFDADRNFQDLIDKIDYFKNLNINAIELMPIMEFEGNESWGYNTSFHMALDKYYGTEEKFKEFVDTCHQNGIAVILDLALNHAFGRNPMVRMWMSDPDGDGWGDPNSENPYFNTTAAHSYSVGYDFDHINSIRTQNYVESVIKHWIEEFKIDGFRWDLTKGFTNNCENNEGCTNDYNEDRVDILKQYADYSWSLDPDHYVIFEHLGVDWDADGNGLTSLDEEIEWANYRADEGKGIMLWGKMTDSYNQLTMGYATDSDISRMGHLSRGFTEPRLVGYAESHDEERLMYKNITYGNTGIKDDLNASLGRMSALGAVSLTIPGPKMIWHFGELGMENSIFTCSNGSYDNDGCKLDTKPQPQWTENWLADTNRSQIYNDWARINALKINEDVFEGNYTIDSGDLTPIINIYTGDLNTSGSELKNVVIVANFETTTQSIVPNFPYTGIWYDLMDETGNTSINITNTGQAISLDAGEFKIYGNQTASLSTEDKIFETGLMVYPNPTRNEFKINKEVISVSIYNLTGKQILTYKGDFEKGYAFNISNLPPSIYLVKVKNNLGAEQSFKMVKL